MTTVVIGIGNRERGDDAAGPEVASRLGSLEPAGVQVLERGHALAMLEAWAGAAVAIVVDAACSGAPAGTVTCFEAHQRPLPTRWLEDSTHAFGVGQTIELARALGDLPPRVVVYAIEGRWFEPGKGLSPEVEAAVDEVVGCLLDELRRHHDASATARS
jgi:hydrogenase maturation protease